MNGILMAYFLEQIKFIKMFQLNETFLPNNNNNIEIWPNKVLLAIYSIVFMVGLSGNILTIYLVIFIKKMQSMTNKFISNLAVADLLVIFLVIPENALRLMLKQPPDIGGHLFCKFTAFIQGKFGIFIKKNI